MLEPSLSMEQADASDLDSRVLQTLQLLRDWGQAATTEQLAEVLIGGRIDSVLLRSHLTTTEGVVVDDGIVCLEGSLELIPKTRSRLAAHTALESTYLKVAEEFTEDLLGWCPFVRCIALAGSLSNGGFEEGDDIDFDLIVRPGTRYSSYLLAIVLGLRYAWRFRGRELNGIHRTPFLPKITCVNVVWSENQTRPFSRQDVDLAFELMHCRPLHGIDRFVSMLRDNRWVSDYFPQLLERRWTAEISPRLNPVGRFLLAVEKYPRVLGLFDGISKGLAWMIYRFVQWTRRHSPEARARMEFLKRVKYPYEVFQE